MLFKIRDFKQFCKHHIEKKYFPSVCHGFQRVGGIRIHENGAQRVPNTKKSNLDRPEMSAGSTQQAKRTRWVRQEAMEQ